MRDHNNNTMKVAEVFTVDVKKLKATLNDNAETKEFFEKIVYRQPQYGDTLMKKLNAAADPSIKIEEDHLYIDGELKDHLRSILIEHPFESGLKKGVERAGNAIQKQGTSHKSLTPIVQEAINNFNQIKGQLSGNVQEIDTLKKLIKITSFQERIATFNKDFLEAQLKQVEIERPLQDPEILKSLKSLEARNNQLQTELEEEQAKNAQLEALVESLKAQLAELKKLYNGQTIELTDVKARLAKAIAELSTTKYTLQTTQYKVTVLELQVTELTAENEDLRNQLDEALNDAQTLRDELERNKKELEEARKANEDNRTVANATEENRKLNNQLKEKQAQIAELTAENKTLESNNKSLSDQLEEATKANNEAKDAKENLQSERDELLKEKNDLKAQLDTANQTITQNKTEIAELKYLNATLKRELEEAQNELKTLERTSDATKTQLQIQLDEATKKIKELEKKGTDNETKITDLEAQNATLLAKIRNKVKFLPPSWGALCSNLLMFVGNWIYRSRHPFRQHFFPFTTTRVDNYTRHVEVPQIKWFGEWLFGYGITPFINMSDWTYWIAMFWNIIQILFGCASVLQIISTLGNSKKDQIEASSGSSGIISKVNRVPAELWSAFVQFVKNWMIMTAMPFLIAQAFWLGDKPTPNSRVAVFNRQNDKAKSYPWDNPDFNGRFDLENEMTQACDLFFTSDVNPNQTPAIPRDTPTECILELFSTFQSAQVSEISDLQASVKDLEASVNDLEQQLTTVQTSFTQALKGQPVEDTDMNSLSTLISSAQAHSAPTAKKWPGLEQGLKDIKGFRDLFSNDTPWKNIDKIPETSGGEALRTAVKIVRSHKDTLDTVEKLRATENEIRTILENFIQRPNATLPIKEGQEETVPSKIKGALNKHIEEINDLQIIADNWFGKEIPPISSDSQLTRDLKAKHDLYYKWWQFSQDVEKVIDAYNATKPFELEGEDPKSLLYKLKNKLNNATKVGEKENQRIKEVLANHDWNTPLTLVDGDTPFVQDLIGKVNENIEARSQMQKTADNINKALEQHTNNPYAVVADVESIKDPAVRAVQKAINNAARTSGDLNNLKQFWNNKQDLSSPSTKGMVEVFKGIQETKTTHDRIEAIVNDKDGSLEHQDGDSVLVKEVIDNKIEAHDIEAITQWVTDGMDPEQRPTVNETNEVLVKRLVELKRQSTESPAINKAIDTIVKHFKNPSPTRMPKKQVTTLVNRLDDATSQELVRSVVTEFNKGADAVGDISILKDYMDGDSTEAIGTPSELLGLSNVYSTIRTARRIADIVNGVGSLTFDETSGDNELVETAINYKNDTDELMAIRTWVMGDMASDISTNITLNKDLLESLQSLSTKDTATIGAIKSIAAHYETNSKMLEAKVAELLGKIDDEDSKTLVTNLVNKFNEGVDAFKDIDALKGYVNGDSDTLVATDPDLKMPFAKISTWKRIAGIFNGAEDESFDKQQESNEEDDSLNEQQESNDEVNKAIAQRKDTLDFYELRNRITVPNYAPNDLYNPDNQGLFDRVNAAMYYGEVLQPELEKILNGTIKTPEEINGNDGIKPDDKTKLNTILELHQTADFAPGAQTELNSLLSNISKWSNITDADELNKITSESLPAAVTKLSMVLQLSPEGTEELQGSINAIAVHLKTNLANLKQAQKSAQKYKLEATVKSIHKKNQMSEMNAYSDANDTTLDKVFLNYPSASSTTTDNSPTWIKTNVPNEIYELAIDYLPNFENLELNHAQAATDLFVGALKVLSNVQNGVEEIPDTVVTTAKDIITHYKHYGPEAITEMIDGMMQFPDRAQDAAEILAGLVEGRQPIDALQLN